jgi:hypothetical protein
MMKKWIMLSIPVLLGVLLIATLVGVAGARPKARAEAPPPLYNWWISEHHCVPAYNMYDQLFDYDHDEFWLRCDAGICQFVCPIRPPYQGHIHVYRLSMYYDDNQPGKGIMFQLYKTAARDCDHWALGETGFSSDGPGCPQVVTMNINTIPALAQVSEAQDLHVSLSISPGLAVYGFRLRYQPL